MEPLDAAKNVAIVVGSLYLLKVAGSVLWSLAEGIRAFFLAPLGISRTNLKKYGQWAVVTGASEGIGRGYALELARQGLDVVIMSRSEEKLQKVASEIKEKYSREVRVIAVDFSAGQDIYPQIVEELKDLDIGILVNNVGYGYAYPDFFASVPEVDDRVKLPGSSADDAACTAKDGGKVFVKYFSDGLRKEYEEKGIYIQTVSPAGVATSSSGFDANLLNPIGETFSRSAVATIGIQKNTNGYLGHALQTYIGYRIPSWLYDRIIWKTLLDMRAAALKEKAKEAKKQ